MSTFFVSKATIHRLVQQLAKRTHNKIPFKSPARGVKMILGLASSALVFTLPDQGQSEGQPLPLLSFQG